MDNSKTEPQVQEETGTELKVHFFPELFLQRRIWILNILRKEGVQEVLEVGCGEGQLLSTLCRPAPWLRPPPDTVLTPTPAPTPVDDNPALSPTYNDEEIPNLHIRVVHGLDISADDLKFAVEATVPPVDIPEVGSPGFRSYTSGLQRWEDLVAKVWHGGLEVINEEFVGVECIVSTEVIEHLQSEIFPGFAPILLGVYHPDLLLVTTPSYTYNARFTAPDDTPSVRRGFRDPTGRTDRIFRHDDHKFEWTREEFIEWCTSAATEWGYIFEQTSIGRSVIPDPYGRDEELQGATNVVVFRRSDGTMNNKTREALGRAFISQSALSSPSHTLLSVQQHSPNPASMKPRLLTEIAAGVKAKMEEYREGFMRVEELWYEKDIAVMCGGWIELLVRAIEESEDLNLKHELGNLGKRNANWNVELVGGVANSYVEDRPDFERESSVDYIPANWTPGEDPYDAWDESDQESNGAEGDVSTYTSDADGEYESDTATDVGWGKHQSTDTWSAVIDSEMDVDNSGWGKTMGWNNVEPEDAWSEAKLPLTALSSASWDGDESCAITS